MNAFQIQMLNKLDPLKQDGNLQSVLQSANIDKLQYQETLLWLLKVNMEQKKFLQEENIRFAKVLKENNLYTNELVFGENCASSN